MVELWGNARGARRGLGEAALGLGLGGGGSEWSVPMLRRQTVSGGRWWGLPSVEEFNRARLPATGGCRGTSSELDWVMGWLERASHGGQGSDGSGGRRGAHQIYGLARGG